MVFLFLLPVLMWVSPYISYIVSAIPTIPHNARVWDGGTVRWRGSGPNVSVLYILCFHAAVQMPLIMAVHEKTYLDCSCRKSCLQRTGLIN